MEDRTRIIVTREALVILAFLLSWYFAAFALITFVSNLSASLLSNINFYFVLLYCFYVVNRIFVWVIEKYLFAGKKREKKKIIDSVAVMFVTASIAGYFLILLWYHYVLPNKV